MTISAGDASNHGQHSSIGGSVTIHAGGSGREDQFDTSIDGGDLKFAAGSSKGGDGGAVSMMSGESLKSSSLFFILQLITQRDALVLIYLPFFTGGIVSIGSGNAGEYGQSGNLFLSTGNVTTPRRVSTHHKDSGSIKISTGFSQHGLGGDIGIHSGAGFGDFVSNKDGGTISILAGNVTGHHNAGGNVKIMSGR